VLERALGALGPPVRSGRGALLPHRRARPVSRPSARERLDPGLERRSGRPSRRAGPCPRVVRGEPRRARDVAGHSGGETPGEAQVWRRRSEDPRALWSVSLRWTPRRGSMPPPPSPGVCLPWLGPPGCRARPSPIGSWPCSASHRTATSPAGEFIWPRGCFGPRGPALPRWPLAWATSPKRHSPGPSGGFSGSLRGRSGAKACRRWPVRAEREHAPRADDPRLPGHGPPYPPAIWKTIPSAWAPLGWVKSPAS
jgi:hypothetical protein